MPLPLSKLGRRALVPQWQKVASQLNANSPPTKHVCLCMAQHECFLGLHTTNSDALLPSPLTSFYVVGKIGGDNPRLCHTTTNPAKHSQHGQSPAIGTREGE
eukprot:5383264-Amphidinium_carterae.1